MNDLYRLPLETYVDMMLNGGGSDHQYPPDLEPYDFVGITEEMDASLAALNNRLGTEMQNGPAMNTVPVNRKYRRAALERMFSKQMEIYEAARSTLRLTAESRIEDCTQG